MQDSGFKIDKVVLDEGVSGIATKLCEREQGRRLFDMPRAGDTLVVRWVDRLGPPDSWTPLISAPIAEGAIITKATIDLVVSTLMF
jgi:putative DNA-invertase from lambdoid prophage Rac